MLASQRMLNVSTMEVGMVAMRETTGMTLDAPHKPIDGTAYPHFSLGHGVTPCRPCGSAAPLTALFGHNSHPANQVL